MKKEQDILVIFDFQCYCHQIEDIEWNANNINIPRKGETVGFNKEDLISITDEAKDFLLENRFFEVNDVSWIYSGGNLNSIRIYLQELKDLFTTT